ncbi:unnamed protein product [Ceratitis capitata]|uniref:hydroxymethylbilane synthase n=1 Tax=Ceratitis capitata TaxID=7213 RepID=A0A811USS6_CERCA|nr:unnamed protein product [Ceratitis capitata]
MLIRIGTRGSSLAIAQALEAKQKLMDFFPDLSVEIIKIKTSGDKYANVNLAEIGEVLPPKTMLSAVGQGAICIQCRKNDVKAIDLLEKINDNKSFIRVRSERSFMKTVNGSCFTPLAALAEYVSENMLRLCCMLADEKGIYFAERTSFVEDAEEMGMDAGLELKSRCL